MDCPLWNKVDLNRNCLSVRFQRDRRLRASKDHPVFSMSSVTFQLSAVELSTLQKLPLQFSVFISATIALMRYETKAAMRFCFHIFIFVWCSPERLFFKNQLRQPLSSFKRPQKTFNWLCIDDFLVNPNSDICRREVNSRRAPKAADLLSLCITSTEFQGKLRTRNDDPPILVYLHSSSVTSRWLTSLVGTSLAFYWKTLVFIVTLIRVVVWLRDVYFVHQ